jgi:hypothetical protein
MNKKGISGTENFPLNVHSGIENILIKVAIECFIVYTYAVF